MTSDIIDIGLWKLSDDELEELALIVETKLMEYLRQQKYWELISDSSIVITLEQREDNTLTLFLDFDTAGAFKQEKITALHQELAEYSMEILKEELQCRKNSMKS